MRYFEKSKELPITTIVNEEPINVIYQYFRHPNTSRHNEIQYALKRNCENPHVNRIILLNERTYTDKELGIVSPKIEQHVINQRLLFKDVFDHIDKHEVTGYNVIVNADIFVDDSISLLKRSNMHSVKSMIALLRYEYNRSNGTSRIFGPRPDSQDTWIMHSNFNVCSPMRSIFNIPFGKPGCDNKIVYLMHLFGYTVYNVPQQIKTLHVHNTNIRDYTRKDVIPDPYGYVFPCNMLSKVNHQIETHFISKGKFMLFSNENSRLGEYIAAKVMDDQPFIIPRIAGIENNYAIIGNTMRQTNAIRNDIQQYLQKTIGTMKKNAGIRINDKDGVIRYSQMYLSAFEHCDMYTVWEPWGAVYPSIKFSHDGLIQMYPKSTLWAWTLDIFNFIHSKPWTLSLRGKRLLVVSAFEDSLKIQIPKREKIYGVDLFPECEFIVVKPPQTQGNEPSEDFYIELQKFCKTLDEVKEQYDVALVSAGGYGNLICDHIFMSGKSAIYVGGVLQMYFGIYGQRWLRERKEVMNLYLNNDWTRPKESERPSNYTNVEGSCYW